MSGLDLNDRLRDEGPEALTTEALFEGSVPMNGPEGASIDAPSLADLIDGGQIAERRWLIEPFFPMQHISVVFAGPKVGKTTLLVALIVDLMLGRYPGEAAFPCDRSQLPDDFEVLYLSEDRAQLVTLVKRHAGAKSAAGILGRFLTIDPKRDGELRSFDSVTAEVAGILGRAEGGAAFATDTLGAWSRESEVGRTNDYGAMTAEVTAWAGLASAFGVAGCLVHHANRQGGYLGSTAIAGCSAANVGLSRPDEKARVVKVAWQGRSDDALHHRLLENAGLLDHPDAERIDEDRRSTCIYLEPFAFDCPSNGLSRSYRKVEAPEEAEALSQTDKARVRRGFDVDLLRGIYRAHPGQHLSAKALTEKAPAAFLAALNGDTEHGWPDWYVDRDGAPKRLRIDKAVGILRERMEAGQEPDLHERNRMLAWVVRRDVDASSQEV